MNMHPEKRTRVGHGKAFYKCLIRLSKKDQNATLQFLDDLKANPNSGSIHLEKIAQWKNPKLRSARVTQGLRAVVYRDAEADVYNVLWVDQHDKAYAWAMNRECDINPETGTLQFYETKVATREPSSEAAGPCLFDGRSEREIRELGVPALIIPAVRKFREWAELEESLSGGGFSEDVERALRLLASTQSFESILEEMTAPAAPMPAEPLVEISPLLGGATPEAERALDATAAEPSVEEVQRAFDRSVQLGLLSDEPVDALREALAFPLEEWRVFLHPAQKQLVRRDYSGPALVQGGAGTGKTVALLHRARHLLEDVFAPTERVLVATLTNNLARELNTQLTSLWPGVKDTGYEVSTIHSVAMGIVRDARARTGKNVKLNVLNPRGAKKWVDLQLQDAAMRVTGAHTYEQGFLREEWTQTIEANGVTSLSRYLSISRRGRGVALKPQQRNAIWPVFAHLIAEQEREDVWTWERVALEARRLVEAMPAPPYRAVLVDEVQDLTANTLRLVRALTAPARNDLFLVGDANQSIYGHRTPMISGGIEVRGRATRLKLNYRTTEEIGAWATGVLFAAEAQTHTPWEDLLEERDALAGYRSERNGPAPTIFRTSSPEAERAAVFSTIEDLLIVGEGDAKDTIEARDIAVVCARNADADAWCATLGEALAATQFGAAKLEHTRAELAQSDVRVTTMHRVKGMEFKYVFITNQSSHEAPFHRATPLSTKALQNAASTLYVAATRARDGLFVSYSGEPSPLLP